MTLQAPSSEKDPTTKTLFSQTIRSHVVFVMQKKQMNELKQNLAACIHSKSILVEISIPKRIM